LFHNHDDKRKKSFITSTLAASEAPHQLSIIVCNNPNDIFWMTPTDRILRPGGATTDGFFASPLVALNDSCVLASLTVDSVTSESDAVTLVAKNRHGMSDLVSKGFRHANEIVISAEISASRRHVLNSVTLLLFLSISLVVVR
jgi:hypothetical protein